MTIPPDDALHRVTNVIAERATALDEHTTDVRDDLARLGAARLFDPALADTGLPDMARTIDRIAARSVAVGFSAWAHTMVLKYLRNAPPMLRDKYVGDLATGSRIGVTGLDAGLEQVAGLGPVPLAAHSDGTGLRITGPVRWTPNVFDGAVLVVAARGAGHDSYVAVVDLEAPGITVDPPATMMALGSTSSTSLHFHDVRVPGDQILSTDLPGFAALTRPGYLLLQAALCAGVGGAALAGAGAAGGVLADQFVTELTDLTTRNRYLRQRLYGLAAERSHVHPAAFVRLRLDAVTLASAATRLESSLVGVPGSAAAGAANRRFREAAFLPVLSPSEGQLRWELSQYRL
jgi:alkylation response protein AidB-like acyl-CoA dehydrogenase